MSICTNESTTKIAKLNSREQKMCKNLGQIRENIGVYSIWVFALMVITLMVAYIYKQPTVKAVRSN